MLFSPLIYDMVKSSRRVSLREARTNSLQQTSLWETGSCLANVDFFRILQYPFIHISLPLVLTLNRIGLAHTLLPHLCKILFSINLPSMHKSPRWFSSGIPTNFCNSWLLSHAWYMSRSSRSPQSDYHKNIWQGIQIMKISSLQFSPVSSYFC
jgi:hypothetical protein